MTNVSTQYIQNLYLELKTMYDQSDAQIAAYLDYHEDFIKHGFIEGHLAKTFNFRLRLIKKLEDMKIMLTKQDEGATIRLSEESRSLKSKQKKKQ
jgi:hypothetical protein